jgi:hypothetical protein
MITLETEIGKQCAAYFRQAADVKKLEIPGESFWVAGGAVRQWMETRAVPKTSDVDVWTDSKEHAMFFVQRANVLGWHCLAETEKAITYRNGRGRIIQLIVAHTFPGIAETLEAFDFTICQFGVSLDERAPIAMAGDTAFQDLAMRRLVVANLEFPESSLARAMKYAGRGFRICGGELGKLVEGLEPVLVERVLTRARRIANCETDEPAAEFGSGRWTGLD